MIIIRTDKNSKHRKLNSSFSSDDEQIINEMDKDVRIGRKLHGINNYVKANGMYSNQEMEFESMNMDRLKVAGEEKEVLTMCWEARHKIHKTILGRYKKFLKDFLEDEE